MTRGYVVDYTHGGATREQWVEGEVEKSVWTGIKTKNRDVYYVDAFRCDACGALRFYALDPK